MVRLMCSNGGTVTQKTYHFGLRYLRKFSVCSHLQRNQRESSLYLRIILLIGKRGLLKTTLRLPLCYSITRNELLVSHFFNTDCLHMQVTEDRCIILSSDFDKITAANKTCTLRINVTTYLECLSPK